MSTANKRTRGVNSLTLQNARRKETGRDSDPQALLSEETIRAFIDQCMCPWCDRGPFKSLASHTNKTHGIDRRELRALAGLTSRDRVSSQEFTDKCRERAIRDGLGYTKEAARGREKAHKTERVYTAAGLRKISAVTSARMSTLTSEEKAKHAAFMAASRTPDGLRRIGDAARKNAPLLAEARRRRSE